jgi:hypothetical protein
MKANKLNEALEKITVDMLNNLEYGEEIELNENYTLYHYCEDDIVVVNETENWDEIFQVLWNDKDITFEKL